MGNHRSRTSASIFDDEEKEFIYKLPLDHDKYYYVAIYRKTGENNFKQVVEVKLMDSTMTNYPFHRQIENSVLPYVGDDSKERLMRKHSKATLLSSQSSNSSSSHQLYDSFHSDPKLNNRRIYDPIFSTVEEFHFLHPNNETSTINIDVVVMRRNGEDNEHSISSLALIGAVCDVVPKEDRKSFMHKLRDICVETLNESGSTFDHLAIDKEDQVLKTIGDSVVKMTTFNRKDTQEQEHQ